MSTDNGKPVGYRKPPSATRFKKGQSGNPKGRPKGTRNFSSDLGKELRAKVTVREGGHEHSVSKQEAIVKSLVAKAPSGDPRALGHLIKAVERLEAQPDPPSQELSNDEAEILETFAQRIRAQVLDELLSAQTDGDQSDDS